MSVFSEGTQIASARRNRVIEIIIRNMNYTCFLRSTPAANSKPKCSQTLRMTAGSSDIRTMLRKFVGNSGPH
jgi:hypothetical protein